MRFSAKTYLQRLFAKTGTDRQIDLPVRWRADLEHDPEKHALGPRPDRWLPVFPRDKRESVCAEIMLKQKVRAG